MQHTTTHWKMTALAGAIGLALGSATAFAQSQDDQAQTSQTQHSVQPDQTAQSPSQHNGRREFEQLAEEHSDLSTFVHAIEAAGLEDSLADGTQYTVFAPTNDAFDSMDGKSTDELMESENRDELVGLLRAHIVADDVSPQQAEELDEALTIDGGKVDIKSKDGDLMVNDAKVTDSQGIRLSDNIRIYPIDAVLAANADAGNAPQARSDEQAGDRG